MTEVYYIEDDPTITHSVKEYLEQHNFHVTIFTTIADARSAVKTMLPQYSCSIGTCRMDGATDSADGSDMSGNSF